MRFVTLTYNVFTQTFGTCIKAVALEKCDAAESSTDWTVD